MISDRQIATPEKNNVLLQKAKFFIFILNNLMPEERFTGPDLYKAFLPASKSVGKHYNSQAAFDEKTWGEDGLQAVLSSLAEIRKKTYWGENLTTVYFFLGMTRAEYERKRNGTRATNGYGEWRSDWPGVCTLGTGIHQADSPKGAYLGDQYIFLKQLLAINFQEEGEKTRRAFMENNESCDYDGITWKYSGKLEKITTKSSGYGKFFKEHEFYEMCFTKINVLNPGRANEFIYIDHPALGDNQGYDFLRVHEKDFNLAMTNEETYLTHTGRIAKTLATGALMKRGSAAIVERLYRTIQLHHLKDWLPKYRLPINLDLLAMFTPHIEWFAAVFPALFFNKHALVLVEQTVQEIKDIPEARQMLVELEGLRSRFQEPENKPASVPRP